MQTAIDYIDNLIVLARRDKLQEILKKTKASYDHNLLADIEENKNKEVSIIDDVRLEGNKIVTEIRGFDYPQKGFSDMETVVITAIYKKFIPLIVKSLRNQNWLQRIITVSAIYFNQEVISKWFETLFSFGSYLLKEEFYQESTQELRRVLKKYFDINIVNAITLIFEYDNAYRYRAQDILPLIDKEKLKGYFLTRKEILRVFDIYLEKDGECRVKMTEFKKILQVLLFIPQINKLARNIIKDLNMDKIKFDEADKYWVGIRKESYRYSI